ncbi:Iron-containing redox enzyme [Actinacidiphila yanglinensis]|uniref:Iron-containing redox enzyme n=1 Tax=Actinacidiphila yanglinensis TaxID=310779 RepID=A0A1H6B0B6_9ACTN|nr:iron-containing redox enzyme family protein [Actinacidiphila yanglinensis]SEG54278.1 Iron-containing redox enzyme [Actinacidiphila yanglinensis]
MSAAPGRATGSVDAGTAAPDADVGTAARAAEADTASHPGIAAPGHGGAGRELRATLDLVEPALRRGAARLWRPAGLRGRYLRYLVAMHAVIRASVPLMVLAAAQCERAGPGDAAARRLADGLARHIVREQHHDDWLLADMAAAGLPYDQALSGAGSPAVARLVGPQYYWIQHSHPACLLGYIAVLEGNAPDPRLAALLASRTGLPGAAFRTLRHHADADPGHSAEVHALLDGLGLDPARRRAVRVSALHTVRALLDLYDGLADDPGRPGADDTDLTEDTAGPARAAGPPRAPHATELTGGEPA